MKNKAAIWLAWLAALVGVVCTVYGTAVSIIDLEPGANVYLIADKLLIAAFAITCATVGALIVGHQPRNTVGGLLLFMGVSLPVGVILQAYLGNIFVSTQNLDWKAYLLIWFSSWSWWLLMGPIFLILLVFPTGRLLTPRWRWVLALLIGMFLSFIFLFTIAPEWALPDTEIAVPNPLVNLPVMINFETILIPWVVTLLLTTGLCLLSVFIRYRRSGIVEREQLKWFISACAVFGLVYSTGALVRADGPSTFNVFFGLALLFIPVSISIAIMRYRLFDIDFIIRRTLIYSALTAILGLLYFGSVVVLQQLFRVLSGQGSDLAIIVSTLVIATLFNPLRERVQMAIDQRFYRSKYDAERALATFALSARDEVDMDELARHLLITIDDSMQPELETLWLQKPKRIS